MRYPACVVLAAAPATVFATVYPSWADSKELEPEAIVSLVVAVADVAIAVAAA